MLNFVDEMISEKIVKLMNLFQRYVNARTDKNFEKSVLTHKKGRVSLTDVVSECERKALIFRHFSAFKRVFQNSCLLR